MKLYSYACDTVSKVDILYIALALFLFYFNLDPLQPYNFLIHFEHKFSFGLCQVQTTSMFWELFI